MRIFTTKEACYGGLEPGGAVLKDFAEAACAMKRSDLQPEQVVFLHASQLATCWEKPPLHHPDAVAKSVMEAWRLTLAELEQRSAQASKGFVNHVRLTLDGPVLTLHYGRREGECVTLEIDYETGTMSLTIGCGEGTPDLDAQVRAAEAVSTEAVWMFCKNNPKTADGADGMDSTFTPAQAREWFETT